MIREFEFLREKTAQVTISKKKIFLQKFYLLLILIKFEK